MDGLRNYLLSVCTAAVLCGLLRSLWRGWKEKNRIPELICGLVMLTVLLKPLASLPELCWADPTASFRREGERLTQEARLETEERLRQVIADRAAAYISDKASLLGVNVTAEVEVDDGMLPAAVILRGTVSPYVKTRLTSQIESDLGIPKEAQVWYI